MTYPAGEAKLNFGLGSPRRPSSSAAWPSRASGRRWRCRRCRSHGPATAAWSPTPSGAERCRADREHPQGRRHGHRDRRDGAQDSRRGGAPVNQIGHAFGSGTAVSPPLLTSPAAERYGKVVTELFNVATLENNLKWVALAGDWGRTSRSKPPRGDRLVARARDRRARPRRGLAGLGEPAARAARPREGSGLPAQRRRRADPQRDDRRQRTGHPLGRRQRAFRQPRPRRHPGREVTHRLVQLARATDPAPKLFINEDGILSGGGGETAHRATRRGSGSLIDGKAPLDAIGMEGHFGNALTAPEDMLAISMASGSWGGRSG